MTPQEIRERNLEKVLFTGYDMGAVDRLREECAEALAAKEKEVAVLSGKIKVLVTSVEEYRATEEEMRRTLRIARQNVWFAIGIKIAVLLLAAIGLATMALAVFADVGVTVLAVLNAMRALRTKNSSNSLGER